MLEAQTFISSHFVKFYVGKTQKRVQYMPFKNVKKNCDKFVHANLSPPTHLPFLWSNQLTDLSLLILTSSFSTKNVLLYREDKLTQYDWHPLFPLDVANCYHLWLFVANWFFEWLFWHFLCIFYHAPVLQCW